MVKRMIVMILLTSSLWTADDTYALKCVPCHQELPKSLEQMFMNYILVYGGEENMKAGLKHYLKFPSKDISVMSKEFIDTIGIKDETSLSEDEIDDALKHYWNKYKIFGKLK